MNKQTYQSCFEFFSAASQWIQKHGEESKFKYALTKVCRKINKLQERYREAVEEINIEHCATEKDTGVILRDAQGQYQYVKEELLKRNREVSKLFHEEVTIEPHFATEVPNDLTDLEKEVFEGFVLDTVESELKVVNS